MFLSQSFFFLNIDLHTDLYSTDRSLVFQKPHCSLVLNIPTGQHNVILRTLLAVIGVKPFSHLSVCRPFLFSALFYFPLCSNCLLPLPSISPASPPPVSLSPSLPAFHSLSAPLPAVLIIFCPSFLLLTSLFIQSSKSAFSFPLPLLFFLVSNLQINLSCRTFTDEQMHYLKTKNITY